MPALFKSLLLHFAPVSVTLHSFLIKDQSIYNRTQAFLYICYIFLINFCVYTAIYILFIMPIDEKKHTGDCDERFDATQ